MNVYWNFSLLYCTIAMHYRLSISRRHQFRLQNYITSLPPARFLPYCDQLVHVVENPSQISRYARVNSRVAHIHPASPHTERHDSVLHHPRLFERDGWHLQRAPGITCKINEPWPVHNLINLNFIHQNYLCTNQRDLRSTLQTF
jgi:hypothetical protein